MFATSRVSDDGMIDPRDTREVIAMSLSACYNNKVKELRSLAHGECNPNQKILIANRGEIARRIMRTAHDMGISTVAIFADGDSSAPFVKEADTAISEGRTTAETYLDVDKVINACKRSGADAVHPGYGFLSENEDLSVLSLMLVLNGLVRHLKLSSL